MTYRKPRAMNLLPAPVVALPALVALLAGCLGQRPPPAIPGRQLPSLELPRSPPPDGKGRVVVDTVGAPSVVNVVEAVSFSTTGYAAIHVRRLCRTPCAIDLPYGQHDLRLTDDANGRRFGAALVDVQAETTFVRAHVGGRTGGGPLALTGGVLSLLGGVAASVAGPIWASAEEPEPWRIATLGGLVALAAGIGMYFLDRPTLQESSSVQWTP